MVHVVRDELDDEASDATPVQSGLDLFQLVLAVSQTHRQILSAGVHQVLSARGRKVTLSVPAHAADAVAATTTNLQARNRGTKMTSSSKFKYGSSTF